MVELPYYFQITLLLPNFHLTVLLFKKGNMVMRDLIVNSVFHDVPINAFNVLLDCMNWYKPLRKCITLLLLGAT